MSVWKRTASVVPKNAPFIQCCRGHLLPEKSPGRGARRCPTVPPRGMGSQARPLPPLPPSPASTGEGDAIARGSIAPGLPIKSIGTGLALGYTLSALRAWQRVAQVPFSGPAALLCLCPCPAGAESHRKRPAKAAIRQLTDGSCATCFAHCPELAGVGSHGTIFVPWGCERMDNTKTHGMENMRWPLASVSRICEHSPPNAEVLPVPFLGNLDLLHSKESDAVDLTL